MPALIPYFRGVCITVSSCPSVCACVAGLDRAVVLEWPRPRPGGDSLRPACRRLSYFSHCESIYIDRLVGSYVWSINRDPARPPPNENPGYALVDDYLVHDVIGTALGEVARRGTACRFAGQECLPSWPDVVYCLVAGWPGGSRVSASGTIARPLLRAGDGTWPWPRRRLPVGHPVAGASTGTCAQDRTFSPPRTTSLSQFV